MIKWVYRRNLIYIIQLFIHYYLRRIVMTVIRLLYKFNNSLIFTLLMHLGEFFGGLSTYIYQNTFLKEKTKPDNKKFGIKLIKKDFKMNRVDSHLKIIILIFFAAFFDFTEYIIATFFVPRIAKMSPTADLRLTGITTISSSLVFTQVLKLKIGKHQFYSLLIMGICLILINIIEFIYKTNVTSFGNLFLAYTLTYFSLIIITFTDAIEKYLNEFNFLNPLLVLVIESVFGILLVLIYSIGQNPFQEVSNFYDELESGKFILLIFLLFLYFAFSAGVNVYKVLSNVLYSPMAKSVSIYILNPLLIIYSFFLEDDFLYKGEKNILYLILNEILSIIIVFFGCIYNEFFVLNCLGLEYETYIGISNRSNKQNQLFSLKDIYDDNISDDEDYIIIMNNINNANNNNIITENSDQDNDVYL